MRNVVVAGIGGLVIGHILWLVGITAAMDTSAVSRWVLVVAAVVLVASAALVFSGWRRYRQHSPVWAAFLLAMPVAPVLLTLTVLGVTYL